MTDDRIQSLIAEKRELQRKEQAQKEADLRARSKIEAEVADGERHGRSLAQAAVRRLLAAKVPVEKIDLRGRVFQPKLRGWYLYTSNSMSDYYSNDAKVYLLTDGTVRISRDSEFIYFGLEERLAEMFTRLGVDWA